MDFFRQRAHAPSGKSRTLTLRFNTMDAMDRSAYADAPDGTLICYEGNATFLLQPSGEVQVIVTRLDGYDDHVDWKPAPF